MNAPEAFMNGAAECDFELLKTLLASPATPSERISEERQTDAGDRGDLGKKPESFHNDPEDPTNPNEARERHLKKVMTMKQS